MIRWLGVLCTVAIMVCGGCLSDKGANSDAPFEAARYTAMHADLESAFAQFCASFDDALAARLGTDTTAIPRLQWPFEMPSSTRTFPTNDPDSNTSWWVSYGFQAGATDYSAFWDLGRFADTGVLIYDSPIAASRVEHALVYNRIDGSGDTETQWGATLKVSLSELVTENAHLSARLTANHTIAEQCNDLPCDKVEIVFSGGEFGKVSGEFDLSTLSGTIAGTITLTEFEVILGHDAVYIWHISGTITDGIANVTASSGKFSETDSFSLCP